MILGNLTVWIEKSNGDRLEEYMTKKASDNDIECWVPSAEGTNFKIGYGCVDIPKDKDLRCKPTLDGIPITGIVSRNRNLRVRRHDFLKDVATSATTRRLLAFGKRIMTDREDVVPSNGRCLEYLNTIKVALDWGRAEEPYLKTYFEPPKENGPIHEKAAKKGHSGSAGLGAVVEGRHRSRSVSFTPLDKAPVTFIFRYGPEDWLQARGIMPCSHSPLLKRSRDTKDDIIDIDDLETNDEYDDEITIIKHLVPARAAPQKKRQKIKGEDVKPMLE